MYANFKNKNHATKKNPFILIIYSALPLYFTLFFFSVAASSTQPNNPEKTDNNRETITIAVHEYVPYYVNGVGLGVDIYKAAFATQNIDVEIINFPIKRAIHQLLNHKIDAFSPGTLFITDEKVLRRIVYETSFLAVPGWLHKPADTPSTTFNFNGKTLAVEEASIDFFDLNDMKGLKTIRIENTERRLKMMLHGRVNYAAVTRITGWHMITKHHADGFRDVVFTKMGKPFSCNLAFSIDNPRSTLLLSSFKKGMKTIKNNGTYVRILESYWGERNVPKDILFDELKLFGTDKTDKNILVKTIMNDQ